MGNFKEILKRLNAPTQKVRCCKCGKEMEMPNPPSKVIYSWGYSSAVIFMVANLCVINALFKQQIVLKRYIMF